MAAFISSLISAFCSIALLLLFVRALLSWFPGQGGSFADAIYGITEPILFPVRKIFDAFNIRSDLPLDISFTVTCVILVMIKMILA